MAARSKLARLVFTSAHVGLDFVSRLSICSSRFYSWRELRLRLRKSNADLGGAAMGHDEAVRTLATEKYLLGEMLPALREQFELRLFNCEECAFDLWAAVTFLTHATAILSNQA